MRKQHLDTVLSASVDYLQRNSDCPLTLFEVASLIILGNLDASDPYVRSEPSQQEKYNAEMQARVLKALKFCPPIFTASQIAPLILTEREIGSATPMVIARRISELLRKVIGPSRKLNGNSVWDRPLTFSE